MKEFKDQVFIFDKVFSEEECLFLLSTYFFKKKQGHFEQFRDTNTYLLDQNDRVLRDFLQKQLNYINKHFMCKLFTAYSRLVEWPTGSFQEYHIDIPGDLFFTSILYLNDNFKGGILSVNDTVINPKKGRLVAFNGARMYHSVSKITEGSRYTVATWYKDIHPNFALHDRLSI